jgi:hypothetical protein
MSAWPFVIAAYAIAGIGALGLLLWAWRSMRAAESQADLLKRRP